MPDARRFVKRKTRPRARADAAMDDLLRKHQQEEKFTLSKVAQLSKPKLGQKPLAKEQIAEQSTKLLGELKARHEQELADLAERLARAALEAPVPPVPAETAVQVADSTAAPPPEEAATAAVEHAPVVPAAPSSSAAAPAAAAAPGAADGGKKKSRAQRRQVRPVAASLPRCGVGGWPAAS